MTKVQVVSAIAMLAGLCVAGSAAAQASASVTLSNISYMLVDLNPADNISPSVSIWDGNPNSHSNLSVSFNDVVHSAAGNWSALGTGALGAAHVSQASSLLSGSATLSGDGTMTGSSLSASSSALGNGTINNFSQAYVNSGEYNFALPAMTAIVFRAISVTSAMTGTGYANSHSEFAEAISQISIMTYVDQSTQYHSVQDVTFANAQWTYDPVQGAWTTSGQSLSGSHELNASLFNFSSEASYSTVNFNVSSYSNSYVSAVPEPASFAMLIAGFALLGLAKRRRA